MHKIDFNRGINNYITDYIKLGDAKAGSIIGFSTLFAGAIISFELQFLPVIFSKSECFSCWYTIILFLFAVLIGAVYFYSFAALSPKTPRTEKSLNSFPDISKFSSGHAYYEEVKALTEDDLPLNISIHNWTLSNIAMKKFSNVSIALKFLMGSFLTCGILFILTIVAKIKYQI